MNKFDNHLRQTNIQFNLDIYYLNPQYNYYLQGFLQEFETDFPVAINLKQVLFTYTMLFQYGILFIKLKNDMFVSYI
jgi:hypothetical protein